MIKDYYVAYCDGACEPKNPGGNLGIGAFVLDPNRKRIFEHSKYIRAAEFKGQTSNNIAEYMAVIAVMEFFIEKKLNKGKIVICGDSKLVIEQLGGTWKAKQGMYLPYYNKARGLLLHFMDIRFQWIPREQNEIADGLSKGKMIEGGCEFRIQKR